jgi:antitoxin HicB
MFKYSINLVWSDEDSAYMATIQEFPGLSAFGDTPEEAVREARKAVKGFIKVYQEDNCKIPEPTTISPYSGQLRIRIPKSLHATISSEAKSENISLNTYIVNLLSERNAYNKTIKEFEEIKSLIMATPIETVKALSPIKPMTKITELWGVDDKPVITNHLYPQLN